VKIWIAQRQQAARSSRRGGNCRVCETAAGYTAQTVERCTGLGRDDDGDITMTMTLVPALFLLFGLHDGLLMVWAANQVPKCQKNKRQDNVQWIHRKDQWESSCVLAVRLLEISE
jgi:hypothetical protein